MVSKIRGEQMQNPVAKARRLSAVVILAVAAMIAAPLSAFAINSIGWTFQGQYGIWTTPFTTTKVGTINIRVTGGTKPTDGSCAAGVQPKGVTVQLERDNTFGWSTWGPAKSFNCGSTGELPNGNTTVGTYRVRVTVYPPDVFQWSVTGVNYFP